MERFFEILSIINSPELQEKIWPTQIAFAVLGGAMLLLLIFLISRTTWIKYALLYDAVEFFSYRPYGLRRMARQWARVMGRLESGSEAEYKLALIEADNLLDGVLTRMTVPGSSVGERLSSVTTAIIPNLEAVVASHELRNTIVRDPDYRLTLEEARRRMAAYEEAFRSLDLL